MIVEMAATLLSLVAPSQHIADRVVEPPMVSQFSIALVRGDDSGAQKLMADKVVVEAKFAKQIGKARLTAQELVSTLAPCDIASLLGRENSSGYLMFWGCPVEIGGVTYSGYAATLQPYSAKLTVRNFRPVIIRVNMPPPPASIRNSVGQKDR